MKNLFLVFIVLISASDAWSHDMTPGSQQKQPILIKNGTLFTVSSGVKENHDLLMVGGKITAIESNITPPENAQVIDATGKHVYPGLIAMSTTLGLVEISSVRATRDQSEVGENTPEVKAHIAYNADSEIIPTVRSNGIAYAEIAPTGRGFSGQSSVVQLDSWNWQDALVADSNGMHLQWPRVGISKSFWERRSPKKQREDNRKARESFEKTFESIKAYHSKRSADANAPVDVRWEAMRAVLEGKQTLFVHVYDYRQIQQAIGFFKKESLNITIVGGAELAMAIELIKQNNTPVVYTAPWGQPRKSDQPFDVAYRAPALLEEEGIPFSLAIKGSWNVRDLPFAAGQAVANGTSPSTALKAITLEPAKTLGIDGRLGSLQVGKDGTVIISKGDLFNHLSHKVEYMWVEGREVDLNNRHKQLFTKYSVKDKKQL